MSKKPILAVLGVTMFALLMAGCELSGAEPPKKYLIKPYISVQPLSVSYYTGPYGDNSLSYPGTPPELKVALYDWNGEDGSLSYQWYTFDDIEEYCKNGGSAIPGATGASYIPTLTAVKDTSYYYYVIVTNTNNDALEETTAEIQSDVAVISFSDPGEPLVPILSRNPSNARYGWGAPLNALQVRAVAPDNGQLSYQWYTNGKVFGISDSEMIPQAIQNLLIPDQDLLDLGDNVFFVTVTNELGKKARVTSIPVKITLEPGKRAAAPRIDTQPKDKLYFLNGTETAGALTIEAVSPDRGALSYQWYSNNNLASAKGGTPVTTGTGGTTKSFTPAVNMSAAGVTYYYVEVTNTNENVVTGGVKTATVTSKPVRVQVGNNAAGLTPNAYFIIPDPKGTHKEGSGAGVDVKNTFQYIRGYGGMDVAWGNFPRTTQDDTHLMYDPERLGYNMLRIMIRADNVDPATTIATLLSGDRPDYYENVKIVNNYGGFVAASPWSPPKDWKSNNSINGGGNLLPGYYKLFATYLRNFAQNMYDNGAPIYCISISNEPNYVAGYDGCEWTGAEMRDFFLEVGHFTNGIRGYGGGKETPYVLTMNGESANTPNINIPALQNPQSKAAIDVLARHIYGERTVSLWNDNKALITKKDADGNDVYMEVWMTEHNINSANATGYYNDSSWNYVWRYLNDVDLVIRMNNENAFVWWASKRFYSMVGDGQYGTTNGAPLPRGWALSHYSRYTIGYNRIYLALDTNETNRTGSASGAVFTHIDRNNSAVNKSMDDMDNTSPRITVFQSQDGESISMVLWTPTKIGQAGTGVGLGTIRVQFPDDFTAQGVSAHRSWGDRSEEIFQLDTTSVALSADRKYAFITLPINQLLSIKFTK